jgi:hypothetical protein
VVTVDAFVRSSLSSVAKKEIERAERLIAIVAPTPESERQRHLVYAFLKDLIGRCVLEDEQIRLLVTGSFPLKVYLPCSDVDVVIVRQAKEGMKAATAAALENQVSIAFFLSTHLPNRPPTHPPLPMPTLPCAPSPVAHTCHSLMLTSCHPFFDQDLAPCEQGAL